MELKQSNTTISAEMILQALADGKEIHLSQCRIGGALDLNRLFSEGDSFNTEKVQDVVSETTRTLVFSRPVYFNSCTFEGDVIFSGPWDQPDCLKVVFEKKTLFNSSVFMGQARFCHAEFKKLVSFDGCTFCRVCTFGSAVFYDRAMFRTVVFEGYALLNEVRFEADTRFAHTCFGKGVNFTDVTFKNRCDFSGVYSRSKSVPIYENVLFARHFFGDGASFWRFVKQVCQEAGYYQHAGECFYRERCGYFWRRFRGPNYEKLSSIRKIGRWFLGFRLLPEFIFGRLLFGYGERPNRVLVTGAVIILLCAAFYSSPAAHLAFQYGIDDSMMSDQLRFLDGLYYSTITFTTLGFGDIYPAADGLTRIVTMLESMAGACLMALFVVTLSKRFSRG